MIKFLNKLIYPYVFILAFKIKMCHARHLYHKIHIGDAKGLDEKKFQYSTLNLPLIKFGLRWCPCV